MTVVATIVFSAMAALVTVGLWALANPLHLTLAQMFPPDAVVDVFVMVLALSTVFGIWVAFQKPRRK